MEYKIGQRVEHKNQGEGYVISIRPDRLHLVVKFLDGIKIVCRADYCVQLYKPGDQVRVKSREELIAINGEDVMYYVSVLADKILTLDFQIEEYEKPTWATLEMPRWEVEEIDFEWHSGVEDKPEMEMPDPNMDEKADGFQTEPLPHNDDIWVSFKAFRQRIADAMGVSPKIIGIDWSEGYNPPVDFLPAEVHQDKDRNRVVLAEVLKIKEPTTNKWMCPKCRFAGSIPDVRQHCVVAHGESLPPPESSSYWETWRVS